MTMRIIKSIALIVLVWFATGSLFADEKRIIYDFEYGIFSRGMEDYKEGDRALTPEGPLEKTTMVPARLGMKFGCPLLAVARRLSRQTHVAPDLSRAHHDQSRYR